jgi:hypothetical protein
MPVLFKCKIYRPFVDERDSGNRVALADRPTEYSRDFVLNPLFITNLLSHAKGSTFSYSDNFGDRRERYSTVICNHSVAAIVAHMDETAHTNAITLPIYPNNNPWGTPFYPLRDPVDTTIQWRTIVYVDRYNPDPEHKCWVVYNKGSFKRVEVLCDLALEDIPDLIRGAGTTSTTFSTVDTVANEGDHDGILALDF